MNEPTMNESEQRIKQLQVLKDIAFKVDPLSPPGRE